jgi:hypothetical protein
MTTPRGFTVLKVLYVLFSVASHGLVYVQQKNRVKYQQFFHRLKGPTVEWPNHVISRQQDRGMIRLHFHYIRSAAADRFLRQPA